MQRIARKVKVNGFTFDSEKEANFYLKFVKESGYKHEVHPSYVIKDKVTLDSYNKELYLVIHNEVCDDYYVDQYESQDNRTRRSRK